MQASDAKEDADGTRDALLPTDPVPAQPDSQLQKSPSVHASTDAASNTADGSGAGGPANANSKPAIHPMAKKDGADARKPVFKAKKRQVIYFNLL